MTPAPARQRGWQIDWAGPHGTAWGTVNACLTTITTAWLTHLAERWLPIPAPTALLTVAAGTVMGVVLVLLRAALGRPRPGATILYQACCWVGAGAWVFAMVNHPRWTPKFFLVGVGTLAVMALVAGVLAALAADDKPHTPPAEPDPAAVPTLPTGADDQATRDALAAEWEQRLDQHCDGDGWKVPNVQLWPRGNGYTVEAIAPAGSYSWRHVERAATAIGDAMDLPNGGGILVTQGVTRKAALIEVTTVDVLAEDYPYPDDRAVHSINDDLEVGIRDDGDTVGPNLRQNCMVLAGEAGSGKSNAGHCVTAEIVTTDDALDWKWDLTGKAFTAWIDTYLKGEVDTPAIDWCARDGDELLFMTRAALRIGQVRPQVYAQVMLDANDDKIPVSPTLPEIVIEGDEVARVTGAMTEHPEAKENLRLVAFEHRAAAVRAVFYPLRGTDDVLSQSIQSQCQVRGVMKIGGKSEANWVLGNYGVGPEDTPYPGCGALCLASGAGPVRLKYYRMKPQQIREISMYAAERRPELDEPSRLAANGRHPDGTPMDGLLPGELDCYDTRWARYRARYGGPATAPAGRPAPGGGQPAPTDGPTAVSAGTPNPAQALADLGKAMAALDAAVAEANASRGHDDITDLSDRERASFDQIMAAEGFGPDWTAADDRPETVPQPGDEQVLEDLIRQAGPAGIQPKDLLAQLAERGIVISRDTLHTRLRALRDCPDPKVYQPRHSRWAWRAEP